MGRRELYDHQVLDLTGEHAQGKTPRRALVVYFSWTGNTRQVAESIADVLQRQMKVTVEEIKPLRERTYLEWLALSCIPNSRVKILLPAPNPWDYDVVFLGTPKWTLSCPPVNEYLHSITGIQGKNLMAFLTYGGFDEVRYARGVIAEIRRKGMKPGETLMVSRGEVMTRSYLPKVESFCSRATQL